MPSDGNIGAPPPEYRPTREFDGGDNSMRNLAIAAVAIAVVVMGGVYVLSHHHGGGVPVIEADATPERVKPADPGGMQVAGADDSVVMNKDGTEADTLASPPETPAPQALQQQTAAATAPFQVPPPTIMGSAPPPDTSAPEAPLPPPTAAAPAQIAPQPEQPAPLPPVAAPAPAPQHPAMNRPIAHPAQPPVHEGSGATQVQLAALDSEAAANAAWAQLVHRQPDLLAGHSPKVVRVDKDGKTFYRLRTGGFASIAEATAFCARLRATGAGCTIASF